MKIEKYKQFIEKAHELYFQYAIERGIKSRWETLSYIVQRYQPSTIVELGTLRSFCVDPLGACRYDLNYWKPNNPSYWDWGSGLFSLLMAEEFSDTNCIIHTIDIIEDNLNICKTYTASHKKRFNYHSCGSSNFLKSYNGSIDLLYMDHSTDLKDSTQPLHLNDARIIVERNLIPKGGLILIDDYFIPEWKRCQLSLPYLLNNGFEILKSEYQILLHKL